MLQSLRDAPRPMVLVSGPSWEGGRKGLRRSFLDGEGDPESCCLPAYILMNGGEHRQQRFDICLQERGRQAVTERHKDERIVIRVIAHNADAGMHTVAGLLNVRRNVGR